MRYFGTDRRHTLRTLFLGCALSCVLFACSAPAPVSKAPFPDHPSPVRIVTPDGEVVQKENTELADEQKFFGTSELLERHLAFMEALDSPPLMDGNEVRLLVDGPQTYQAMFTAIANAREHIHLETYIIEEGKVGRQLSELLSKKAAEGIDVRLLYDSVGALNTSSDFFNSLSDAGVVVREFNPINPIKGRNWNINGRDHRKILVIDGRIAFTGGVNISNVYSSGSASQRGGKPSSLTGWRDTHVQIQGPAVAEFQRLFLDAWQSQGEPIPRSSDLFPTLLSQGKKLLRVIASKPGEKQNVMYHELLSAIRHAEHSVYITMAYFVPDRNMLEALCQAAQRGVDVQLILPGFSDSSLVFHAGRSFYDELISAGVKLYERQDALLHAKTAVIDGVWSFVGSMNMDMRSFLHNQEVIAVVLGDSFAKEMHSLFQHDRRLSTPITIEEWRNRGASLRLQEWFARWWEYWL